MNIHEPPLNKRTLAHALGLTPSSVGHWEKGSQPRIDAIHAIVNHFGRPISEVFIKAGYATPEQLKVTAPPIDAHRNLKKSEVLAWLEERIPDEPVDHDDVASLRSVDEDDDDGTAKAGKKGREPRTTRMARKPNP
ncbi:helix-turn-helix domain-containing protein [Nocardia sp. NPDC057455]|uniref:helix-turn-helix domain-containing protein n=1 Tax=Nocardia sp. NPDC057455 TaxID=3346138 RepID=UPI00366C5E79